MKYFWLLPLLANIAAAATEYNSLFDIIAATPACAIQCSSPAITGMKCVPGTVQQYADCVCEDQSVRRKMLACAQEHCSYADVVLAGAPQKAVCKDYPFPSRMKELVNASVVLLAVTIPFMLLRLWSRGFILRVLWWDDALLAVASAFLIAFLALIIPLAQGGLGRHSWDINNEDFPALAKMSMSCQVFYNVIQQLCKLSILVCFLRIFPQRPFRIAVILTCIFIVMKSTAYLIITIWHCSPINAQWNFYVPGKCINGSLYLTIGGIIGIVEDIWILILPLPMLRTLRIPRGQKFGVAAMLGVGSLACITSILRLRKLSDFGFSTDPAWDNTDTSLWSMIECSVAVICASLPALRPLLTKLSPRLFGSIGTQRSDKPASTSTSSKIMSKFSFGRKSPTGESLGSATLKEDGSCNGNAIERGEEVKMYSVVPKLRDVESGKRRPGEEKNTSRECFDLDDVENMGKIKVGIMVQQDFEVQSQREVKNGARWIGPFISR